MQSFENIYEQCLVSGMREDQAQIIASIISQRNKQLESLEKEISNLHSKIDEGFDRLENLIKNSK